jgi:hypothetical protein
MRENHLRAALSRGRRPQAIVLPQQLRILRLDAPAFGLTENHGGGSLRQLPAKIALINPPARPRDWQSF